MVENVTRPEDDIGFRNGFDVLWNGIDPQLLENKIL